ncbi:hypothetical protein B0H21DRAFT_519527 [Amylocystis lapponica]|nr:hypothetical protein B0H21DRAFT_519527 [Amylocystis lapponica]
MSSTSNVMEGIDWSRSRTRFEEYAHHDLLRGTTHSRTFSSRRVEERAFQDLDGADWDVVFASSRAFNDWLCEDPFAGPSTNVPSLVWDGTPSSSSSSLVATPSDFPQYTWADEHRCDAAGPSVVPAEVFQSPVEEFGHLPEVVRDHWPSVGSPAPPATFGGARYHDAPPSQPPAPQRRARRTFHPYTSTGRIATRAERGMESVIAPTIGIYERVAYVAPQAMVPAPSSSAPSLPQSSREHVRGRARSPEPSINGQVQCLWRNCPQWMAPEAVAAHICHAHNAMAGLDKDGRVKCRRCPSGKQCTGRVLPENFAMHIWRVHFQDKFIFSG